MNEDLNGTYYYFDCMNAFISERYFASSAFQNEAEAIRTAANYEATLYKVTFDENGEQVSRDIIYDPFSCFG